MNRELSLVKYIAGVALSLLGWAASAQNGTFRFIENKGQWDKRILYSADFEGSTGAFYLNKTGYTTLLANQADVAKAQAHRHGQEAVAASASTSATAKTVAGGKSLGQPGKMLDASTAVRIQTYHVEFVGANPNAVVEPDKQVADYNNYFIGSDPSKWAAKCKLYQALLYKDLYPGIDVRYYSEAGRLKYDLIVHPGADLSTVKLKYSNVSKLGVKNNQLHVTTSVGEVVELYPYSYQPQATGREEVNCKYKVQDNIVSFEVKEYDRNTVLVIDPSLIFSTFTGSRGDNWGFTATYGADGSMYLGGIANSGYLASTGAYDETFNGTTNSEMPGDIAIIKLSSNGKQRVYATYIGGSQLEQPHSMIENSNGELLIAGRTNSSNFPSLDKEGDLGDWDIIICRLSADGSQLLGSIQVGGTGPDGDNISEAYGDWENAGGAHSLLQNYGDDARSEIIVNSSGEAFVASCTRSSVFPKVGVGFQPALAGAQDGVVIKVDAAVSKVMWTTCIGGSGNDAAYVLSFSPLTGQLYVGGGTASSNFPGVTTGVVGPSYNQGSCDGFVARLNDNGTSVELIGASYIGTAGIDQVYGIQFDKKGFPYVMGTTTNTWPIINAAYNVADGKQFIGKLKPDLSAYVYSTAFGTTGATAPNISPVAFLVDRCENVYVSGWGGRGNVIDKFPSAGTGSLPVTSNAVQPTTDGSDFYFFVMKRDAESQLYGTYFGQKNGSYPEHVDGGTSRFDQQGVIYQAMCANCYGGAAFPTSPVDVWAANNGTGQQGCNEAGVKIAFNLAGVGSDVIATVQGRPANVLTGCVPMLVNLTDSIGNATEYIWNFGDGSANVTTTVPNTSHTYTAVGTYTIQLVSIDSNSCNIADTSYTTVQVRQDEATIGFTQSKVPPCESLTYQFVNTSVPAAGKTFTDSSFQWDFGDGSAVQITGLQTLTHTYAAAGTYTVTMTMIDTSFCNYPDAITSTLRISTMVKAQFEIPALGCAPYNAVFKNTSMGGQQFIWTFGDGTGSTEADPTHLYSAAGTYTIQLIAIDSSSCNIADTATFTITLSNKPTAAFSWTPNPPVENIPVTFTNLSSTDAVRFDWLFGDGDTLITTLHDTLVTHQYNGSGTYTACLIATNAAGCSDTACAGVETIVVPLLDVPNAFTPGRFGVNSIAKVRGFGITKITWRIYNRWGQVVFVSNSINDGWDGNYKGTLQPMDVYAYTLEAEFSDGTRATKKGDITLLR